MSSHQHDNNEAQIIGGIESSDESLKYGLKNVIDKNDNVLNKLDNQIAQGISDLHKITGNGIKDIESLKNNLNARDNVTVPVHNATRYNNGHLANTDVAIIDMEAGEPFVKLLHASIY